MVAVLYGSQFGKDFEIWTEGDIEGSIWGEQPPKEKKMAGPMK